MSTTTLHALHQSQQAIYALADAPVGSVESLSQTMAHNPLFDKLTALFDGASTYVKGALGGLTTPKKSVDLTKMVKALESNKLKYLDLRGIPVPVAPGQVVGYKEYFMALSKCQNVVNNLYDYTLEPFQTFLGETLNQPQKLASNLHTARIKDHHLDTLRTELARVVSPRGGETLPYEKAVRSNSEWLEVADLASDLVAAQKKVPQDLIVKTITDIDDKLSKVLAGIEDTNQQYRPTPTVIKQLADICYMLAEHVMFYSAYATQLSHGLEALNQVEETVKGILEN